MLPYKAPQNNVWGNSLTFGGFGAGAGFRVEDAETEVFDAETETRVVRLVLGLGLVWRMGDGRMEQESERDIEAMETESEDR